MWFDWWIREKPLNLEFPRLFNIDSNKLNTMEEGLRLNRSLWDSRMELRISRSMEELNRVNDTLSTFQLENNVDKWSCSGG